MTREEAINCNKNLRMYMRLSDKNQPYKFLEENYIALDMAIKALEQEPSSSENPNKWIPVKWHEITDEERKENNYPKDWACFLDSIMPYDGQRILVTTKGGYVELDECYSDDGQTFSLDSGYDWVDDVVAWMPLPEPYKTLISEPIKRKGLKDILEDDPSLTEKISVEEFEARTGRKFTSDGDECVDETLMPLIDEGYVPDIRTDVEEG